MFFVGVSCFVLCVLFVLCGGFFIVGFGGVFCFVLFWVFCMVFFLLLFCFGFRFVCFCFCFVFVFYVGCPFTFDGQFFCAYVAMVVMGLGVRLFPEIQYNVL